MRSRTPKSSSRRRMLGLLATIVLLQGFALAAAPPAVAASFGSDRTIHTDPSGVFPERRETAASSTYAQASSGPACANDHAKAFQMLYVHTSGQTSRLASLQSTFLADAAAAAERMIAESSPAPKRPRFICGITSVQMPRAASAYVGDAGFDLALSDLFATVYKSPNRKYLIWWDGIIDNGTCGLGTFYRTSTTPDPAANMNNGASNEPDYALVFRQNATDFCPWQVTLHEMMHTIGAVLDGAPNFTVAGHCTDGRDIMCYPDGPGVIIDNNVCPGEFEYLDCGKDNYFAAAPTSGGWLATHWNTYNSYWLESSGSVGPPETTFTGKPSAFSNTNAPVFAFSASAQGSTFSCTLDGGTAQACTSPVGLSGLSDGQHTFTVAATANALTDATPASWTWKVDTLLPSLTFTKPSAVLQTVRRIEVGWSASDANPLTHEIWQRTASISSGFSSYFKLRSQLGPNFAFDGTPGVTYCFKIKVVDAAGNANMSGERCAAPPVDDRTATVNNWTRSTGSSFYLGTVSVARVSGARMTVAKMRAKSISVLVQVCSTCRYVDAYWNGTLIKKMSLYTSGAARMVHVPLKTFGSVTTGRLEFVVVSPSAVIDAIGASQI